MTVLDQVAEMLLQRVAADTRQFDRIANRDTPVLAGKFDDLQLQLGQGSQYDLFALHLLFKPSYLLGQ